jgi:acetyltransferase-like isoleucine patch superfamily enzyme
VTADRHPGTIPANVVADPSAYVGTSYCFSRFRSAQPAAVRIGRGASLCDLTVLDVGPRGRVTIGDYAMLNHALIICDELVTIGDYALVGWDVVVMDAYRLRGRPARPVHIGRNAWVGFESCILPGIRIGEGAVVAARSVVLEDVPPHAVVAGNPARVVRYQDPARMRTS